MTLIKHRAEMLKLREDAPFPSDLRDMLKQYREQRDESNRPDSTNGIRRPFPVPVLTLVGKP